ncbi:MAG: starch phosphorylase, partial [Bradymonadia bacterium]
QVWAASHHNPLVVLSASSDRRVDAAFQSAEARFELDSAYDRLQALLSKTETWTRQNAPVVADGLVAYFCAEFGMHESVPLYSGGLGVLAGDHIKTASDLGIPFVGISLRYSQGYFRQSIDDSGWQQEHYPPTHWQHTPVKETLVDGQPLYVEVPLDDRTVRAQIYQLAVGRSTLYLMETDIDGNAPEDRALTDRLYGGDNETRIRQEILLGIGGVRLLRALGHVPSVYHLNEGHSAFACFEMIREQVALGHSFEEALAWVRERTLYTTHTPVPAGHDRFVPERVTSALRQFEGKLGVGWHRLVGLGRVDTENHDESFCMTVVALKCAGRSNGVSKLHGEVSREMWRGLFPGVEVDDVPIGHVTNGVHVETFMQPTVRRIIERLGGEDWGELLLKPTEWEALVDRISDEQLVALKLDLKRHLGQMLRTRIERRAATGSQLATNSLKSLDHWQFEHLTIGFARRFATYKRGDLIFRELEKAKEVFCTDGRPVQLLIAGKAHPRDVPGKTVIQEVVRAMKQADFGGQVLFLEDYDLALGRALTSGVDVWLNNPRRPREASGTSGQKVVFHGGINLSILDGWWAEGYDGSNGFAIGDHEAPKNPEEQDARDKTALYDVLLGDVIPEFYADGKPGANSAWVKRMRNSMKTLSHEYSTRRMLRDYVQKFYSPISSGSSKSKR